MKRMILVGCLGLAITSATQGAAGILFDATKAESASNADWVIDADTFNLGVNSSTRLMQAGRGNDSNPQRYPTAAASGIKSTTTETYWKGGLSAWGVDSVKRGMAVQTLPYNGAITYGSTTNAQDLSKYKVFVVTEPNIKFTSTEKTALIKFVKAGGGLMMIADHNNSDRNNDGVDSVDVWNDFIDNNGTASNPFGIRFNYNDISTVSPHVNTTTGNPLTRGAAGTVSSIKLSGATTLTIDPTKNSSVKGAVWQSSAKANNKTLVAYATYGLGKVVAIGDSSLVDDGTGDTNDVLYNGWSSVSNSRLAANATLWLNSTTATAAAPQAAFADSIAIVPEPGCLLLIAIPLLTLNRRKRR